MMSRKDDYDPQKEHYELELSDDGTQVLCTKCHKVLEEREGGMPDYSIFLGAVFIKQNLPCEPTTSQIRGES